LEYANDQELTDRIQVDRQALRSLVRYYGRDKDVSVSFSASALGRRVIYQPEENILIIHEVPEGLRASLG